MANKLQQSLDHAIEISVVKWFIIPVVLLVLSFFFFLLYGYSSKSLLIIHEHGNTVFKEPYSREITARQKISGELTSVSNYLGIAAIRFNTFGRINGDTLVFRIKEKGAEAWYYQNKYLVDQFQDGKLFPFGFPPIADSNNKEYQIEIQSLRGEKQDAVAISTTSPVMTTTYQLPFKQIFFDRNELLELFTGNSNGVVTFFSDVLFSHIDNIAVLLTPTLAYFFWQFLKTKKARSIFLNIIIFSIIGYIFFIGKLLPGEEVNSPSIIVILVVCFIIMTVLYKVSYLIFFLFTIMYLLLTIAILAFLDRPDIANRSAIFAYSFLLVGTVLGLLQYKQAYKRERFLGFLQDLWVMQVLSWISHFFSQRSEGYNKLIHEVSKIF